MTVEKRNCTTLWQCAERNLAGCRTGCVFYKLFALKTTQIADCDMGEFIATLKNLNLAYNYLLFLEFILTLHKKAAFITIAQS